MTATHATAATFSHDPIREQDSARALREFIVPGAPELSYPSGTVAFERRRSTLRHRLLPCTPAVTCENHSNGRLYIELMFDILET